MKVILVILFILITIVCITSWIFTPQESDWIVGYGSLINASSRLKTLQQSNSEIKLPEWYSINIKGYRRSWTAQSNTTTYLGVDDTNNDNDIINAVAFRIDNHNLIHFDSREHLYTRMLVPLNRLIISTHKFPVGAKLWIYVTLKHRRHLPTKSIPVTVKYVETFLTGCADVDKEKFLNDCLFLTDNWKEAVISTF